MFFRVLHKVLYRGNSKIRFLWHRDNGKIDRFYCYRDTLNSNPNVPEQLYVCLKLRKSQTPSLRER